MQPARTQIIRSTTTTTTVRILSFIGLVWLAMLIPIACSRRPATPPPPTSTPAPTFRIVCLSPALTDILIDLGLENNIVGRDIWEKQLPDSVPRVGDLYQLDYEALIALQPTDVILQVEPDKIPPFLNDTGAQKNFRIVAIHINTLPDILSAMRQLIAQLSFTGSESQRTAAQHKADEIESRINTALQPLPQTIADHLGPVLILHDVQPPAAFGPDSYLVQVLETLGAPDALTTGGPWQELDLETVADLDPWAIILIKPGAPADADKTAMLGPLADLKLSAVKNNRIAALTHPQSLLPGTCIADVADELRSILTRFAKDTTQTSGPDR